MKKMTLLTVVFVFTFSINAQTAIQEFNFNGILSNVKNDVSFFGNAKFVNDRAGADNKAIRLTNSAVEATVLNLPLANSSRTVSVWIKYNSLTNVNYIWGYGSPYNARYFGLIQQSAAASKSDLNLAAGYGTDNDVIVTTKVVLNTWYNYVVTYDGLNSKIYRNGELIKSFVSSKKMTSGIVFSLGKMGTSVSINADIDDLKIYDVALAENEVMTLYNGSFNLVSNDVATVDSGTKTSGKVIDSKTVKTTTDTKQKGLSINPAEMGEVKSSEIFSTRGLKVYTGKTNEIDVSSLPEGTYLLKITNSSQNSMKKNNE